MRFIYVCVLFIAFFLVGSPSIATSTTIFRIADWTGHVDWNKQERQLEHCSAELTNADKITLIFSLNARYEWSLDISSPVWRFTKGASFPVAFRFTDGEYLRTQAVAADAQLIQSKLPDSLTAINAFRRTNEVQFIAGALISRFDFTAVPQVVMALTKCALRYGTFPHQRTAISAWLKTLPSTKDNSDTQTSKEASDLARDVLIETRIPNTKRAQKNEIPADMIGDSFWEIGRFLFSVSILKNETLPVDQLSGLIIGADAEKCRGDMFAGATTDVIGPLRVARAITNCVTLQSTSTIYYLAVPRKQGGIYLLSTITNDFEMPTLDTLSAANVDLRVRSSVSVALAKLSEQKH